jgi:predicted GH43/DUF377 family glycosyl hydrolase
MKWDKLGLIFHVNNQFDWMNSYATKPVALNLKDDLFRIYFSTRDKENRSQGAFIDIDINIPSKILNISSKPIIKPGNIGAFDDSGVQPSSVLKVNNKLLMYYTGWLLSSTIPFRTFLGLAINEENEGFEKYSSAPILSWDKNEPYSIGLANVIYHDNIFKMWYESNLKWNYCNKTNIKTPVFEIKFATSNDGINWKKSNVVCVNDHDYEKIVSSPSVIINNDLYQMWYCFKRNGLYKIGYAESMNGKNWQRKDDEVGIDISESGWDSEQIEYPFVFDHKGERYMLYNGNGYGKTGFGLAKLIKE